MGLTMVGLWDEEAESSTWEWRGLHQKRREPVPSLVWRWHRRGSQSRWKWNPGRAFWSCLFVDAISESHTPGQGSMVDQYLHWRQHVSISIPALLLTSWVTLSNSLHTSAPSSFSVKKIHSTINIMEFVYWGVDEIINRIHLAECLVHNGY